MEQFNYERAFSRNIGWITDAEQHILRNKTIAVAGCGGVGGEHLVTLARLGIENYSISDFDEFEQHNFNRQAGAFMSTQFRPKCEVMKEVVLDINPHANIRTYDQGIDESNVDDFLDKVDLYVDSLDFFALSARKLVLQKCYEKDIPVVIAAPLGMGCAFVCFLPGEMSYEEYFRFNDAKTEEEAYILFLVGLSPAMLQRSYLVDPSKADFRAQKGPSTPMSVKLCSGMAGTFAAKILLNRGDVPCAPYGLHFDAYLNKFKKTWRPGGNRNPIQRIFFNIAKKIVLKDKPKLNVDSDESNYTPAQQVMSFARWAPSGDNTQPWQFEVIDEHSFVVHGRDESDWMVYDKNGSTSKLALGCLLENCELAAQHFGYHLTTELIANRFNQQPDADGYDSNPTFKLVLQKNTTQSPAADNLFHYIKSRSVQRKPMATKPLSPQQKRSLEQALPPGFKLIWKESFKDRLAIANLMFGHGFTRFSMKEGFDVHSKVIEYTPEELDTSPLKNANRAYSKNKMPLKSLGVNPVIQGLIKWSLADWPRFEFMSKYLGSTLFPRFLMDWLPVIKSSAAFAIVAEQPPKDLASYINAGKAIQRLWLKATELNLGFQPGQTPVFMSELLRQNIQFTQNPQTVEHANKMEQRYQALFPGNQHEKIVFMGRIGFGPQVQYRSVRLSLDELTKQ